MNAKRLTAVLAIVGLVLLGGQAFAEIGTIDQVPAATLLLPYFEVDLDAADSTSGLNTYFSVNNASAAPTIAHVVIWSDYTVPLLDFNIYLTGYDVQTINLYDIIALGNLPTTADAGRDTAQDTISPQGPATVNGQPIPAPLLPPGDDVFASCQDRLPVSSIPPILVNRLQNGLTGQGTQFDNGRCVGFDHGDNIARGYITVDNVSICSLEFPGDDDYFNSTAYAEGARFPNQLWGDFQIVDAPNNFAIGETLVHIEAANGLSNEADYTFYGRYSNSGPNDREALGNAYATRYIAPNPVFTGGTDLLVWRESGVGPTPPGSFVCANGSPGAPFPLNEWEVVAFDEQEDWQRLCRGTQFPVSPPLPGDPFCFPLEAQRVTVGEGDLAPPFDFGWMYLDLDVPTANGDRGDEEQAWVITNLNAGGLYSVGYNGIQLNNLTFIDFNVQ